MLCLSFLSETFPTASQAGQFHATYLSYPSRWAVQVPLGHFLLTSDFVMRGRSFAHSLCSYKSVRTACEILSSRGAIDGSRSRRSFEIHPLGPGIWLKLTETCDTVHVVIYEKLAVA